MAILNNKDKEIKRKKTSKSKPQGSSTVGVQKIKSALRQTRRLLAKDNLAADVRIESERRLKSLESDLEKAEQSRKERHNALKYHKVKFFERQKVCRKIKQVKKELGDESLSPARLTELQESLFSLRVDLNYILHYPKLRKYISLFPSSNTAETSESDAQREELRRQTKAAMQKGELSAEPELKMDEEFKSQIFQEQKLISDVSKRKDRHRPNQEVKSKGLSGDAFFEASDEENS